MKEREQAAAVKTLVVNALRDPEVSHTEAALMLLQQLADLFELDRWGNPKGTEYGTIRIGSVGIPPQAP